MDEDWQTTDVIICGCGPTGAMLSGYLGQNSINNVVIEKESAITTDPRGIALDEDGIRLLQGLGIYDKVFREIGTCLFQFRFIGGKTHDLMKDPFLIMDYGTTEGGTGHIGFLAHHQPTLEKHLRNAMADTGCCQLNLGSTVTDISEDQDWVYCRFKDSEGVERRVRGRYFVGADGKTGFTRKQYLEPRGIKLERAHNAHYEEVWVALNWRISLPTPESHPDFPLWKLGYKGQDVYDAFFPTNFRFLCNPGRPAVCGRFGLVPERLWRFEFVVQAGEDPMEMTSPEQIDKIVLPYLRHPGRRYGLNEDVEFPKDCIEVLRCRPFMFSARSCNKWALNRVVLCGDSAHVFPPFGGQGIASGFRDASSLAWRLAVACRSRSSDRNKETSMITAWYSERKQQLERSLASTVENGQFVTAVDPFKILARDWYLWLTSLVSTWRHQHHLGNRREGMIIYKHQPGMPFIPHLGGGKAFPQVYCRALGEGQDQVFFTDDVIWNPTKPGLFRLAVLLKSVNELEDAYKMVSRVSGLCGKHIRSEDVTIIILDDSISDLSKYPQSSSIRTVYRIATADEFAGSELCYGRPAPRGYDPLRLGVEVDGKKFIFLRPDRFVFAACNTEAEVEEATKGVNELLDDCYL